MAQFSVFTPYPGTPKFEEFRLKIVEEKFEKFSQFALVFNHPEIDRSQSAFLVGKAHKKFYFNLLMLRLRG